MYVLHIKHKGGCDYTISCGETIIRLSEATNDIEAKRDAMFVISEHLQECTFEYAKIYKLASEIEIDTKIMDRATQINNLLNTEEEAGRTNTPLYISLMEEFKSI